MGQKTNIEWCDSTLNPMMGCDGCELWNPRAGVKRCYAGRITERYASKNGWPESFDQPRIFPGRLKEALRWSDLTGKDRPNKPWLNGYPRVIFPNDMGDTWTESLPLDWLEPLIDPLASSPHVLIFLTKRPGRAIQFWTEWCRVRAKAIPQNFWLLTSVTGSENVGRIRELLKLRALGARVLGVSYEPAWDAADFTPWLPAESLEPNTLEENLRLARRTEALDWVICGGESGTVAKPSRPDWFRAARDACQAAGVAFFFKQWGEWAPDAGPKFMVATDVGGTAMYPVGKKAAGALLDGREWREMPRNGK